MRNPDLLESVNTSELNAWWDSENENKEDLLKIVADIVETHTAQLEHQVFHLENVIKSLQVGMK